MKDLNVSYVFKSYRREGPNADNLFAAFCEMRRIGC